MDSSQKYQVIFVLGNPGSGKNTQCDLIKEKYKLVHFGCGDLLRAEASNKESQYGELINGYIKDGAIVPAKITCSLAKREMDTHGKSSVFLIDGFPRNKENLDGWNGVFGSECEILSVLLLDCSDEICTQRIKIRSQSSGRIDDNDDSLKRRFKVFQEETMVNINDNLSKLTKIIKINSEVGDKQKIFDTISAELDKVLPSHSKI